MFVPIYHCYMNMTQKLGLKLHFIKFKDSLTQEFKPRRRWMVCSMPCGASVVKM